MKLYKDKDPYVYNESLFNKQRKRENRIKRIISALMACEIFCSVMAIDSSVKYEINHSNPFDEQSISSSDFVSNYKAIKSRSFIEDESLKETIEHIKNSNIDEKKAYLLYYALLSNESLTKEEKEKLTGYIQYFIDNKYLDYEYVYNQLNQIVIKERNAKFPGTNISSTYNKSENSIRLGNINDLPHEIRHSIMNVPGQVWLNEGYNCIITEEYDGGFGSSVETNVIRVLCEMMGKESGRDCFFYMSSVNSIEPLSKKLKELGIEPEKYEELYSLLNELAISNGNLKDIELNEQRGILRKKISGLLAIMIRDSNIDKENMNSAIIMELLSRISLGIETNLNISNFYYFNKEKIKEHQIPNEITNYYYPVEKVDDKMKEKIMEQQLVFTINASNGKSYFVFDPYYCDNAMYDESYLLEEINYYDKNLLTTNIINKKTNEIVSSLSEKYIIDDVISLSGNYEYYQNEKVK